jgi:hypothetical protein
MQLWKFRMLGLYKSLNSPLDPVSSQFPQLFFQDPFEYGPRPPVFQMNSFFP